MVTSHDYLLWIRIRELISPMQTGPTSQISIFEKKFYNGLTLPFFVRFVSNFVQRSLVSLSRDSECLKWLRPFFDLPARPTKIDQKWKFLTSVFFVRFGWNLVWGLIMGQKQHRMSLICLRPFFDLPARPTKIDQKWKFLTSVFFAGFVKSPEIWKSPEKPGLFKKARAKPWAFSNAGLFQKCGFWKENCALKTRCTLLYYEICFNFAARNKYILKWQ